MSLKRDPVKFLRDFLKKDHKYGTECYICGCQEKLELHHIYTLSYLWDTWARKNGINRHQIRSVEEMIELRPKFFEDNKEYLNPDDYYMLCKQHHARLHNLFGLSYSTVVAEKVKVWIEKQRNGNFQKLNTKT